MQAIATTVARSAAGHAIVDHQSDNGRASSQLGEHFTTDDGSDPALNKRSANESHFAGGDDRRHFMVNPVTLPRQQSNDPSSESQLTTARVGMRQPSISR
jgi:hypothetical protein